MESIVSPLARPPAEAPPGLRLAPWLVLIVSFAAFGWLGPLVNQDSLFNLLAARDGRAGAPWNHLYFPDPGALTELRSAFLAWWPPAQGLIPEAWQRLGLRLGPALTLTSALALASGLLGFVRLYRTLGYDSTTVGWSVLLLALSEQLWHRAAEYHGGEALLFGTLPWITLAALRVGLSSWGLIALPLLFAAGASIKLSFSIAALAIVVTLWAQDHAAAPFSPGSWKAAGIGAAAFALFYAPFVVLFQRLGVTPNAVVGPRGWSGLPLMPAGPFSFVLNGQPLTGRLLPPLDGAMLWLAIFAVSLAALLLLGAAAQRAPTVSARAALLAFYAVNVAAISFLHWRGNRVWFCDRIFLSAGVMLLPALVHLARTAPTLLGRWSLVVLLAAATSFSCVHGWNLHRWQRTQTAASPQGIRHAHIDATGLREWLQINEVAPNPAIAFFADPATASLALEWPRWRRFVPAYAALCGRDLLAGGPRELRGRPPALAVVDAVDSPPEYSAEAQRARFVDVPPVAWRHLTFGHVRVWTTLP